MGDNADICPGGDDLIDIDEDGTPDYCDLLVDSDGDGIDDAIDAFPDDNSEWVDSDGDGVGNNKDAYPSDPLRSVAEEDNGNQNNQNNEEQNLEEKSSSDSQSWSEFLSEKGFNSDIIIQALGAFLLVLIIMQLMSSRKIRKLKQELDDITESKEEWERLDLDGDGKLSDLEIEAYKLIRDKGDSGESADGDSNPEDSQDIVPEQYSATNPNVGNSVNDWLLEELE